MLTKTPVDNQQDSCELVNSQTNNPCKQHTFNSLSRHLKNRPI